MPRAIPRPVREQIVERHAHGEKLGRIAASLALSYRAVQALCKCYEQQGEAGLENGYGRCGKQGVQFAPAVQQAALQMKREHARWGGGLIRLQLAEQFPAQKRPGVRTLQSWFAAAGLQPARAQRPPQVRRRGSEPHAVWQMDAKERMRLADGTGTSTLEVTDEASGALLGAEPFPPVSLDASAACRRSTELSGTV
jgi:hypothetical protein